MAKPIEKLPAFKGRDAQWLSKFLASPKNTEDRIRQRAEGKKLLERVQPMERKSQ